MCNRLPKIKKSGDAGIFPVYYSLKYKYRYIVVFFLCCVEEVRKREAATTLYTPTRSTETRANSPSEF